MELFLIAGYFWTAKDCRVGRAKITGKDVSGFRGGTKLWRIMKKSCDGSKNEKEASGRI